MSGELYPTFSAPFVDDRKIVTNVWQKFILGLWQRTGSGSGSAGVPTGTMVAFGGANAPDGWLACDGSAISRSVYAALFGVIGSAWGGGNGSSTFNLPNLDGRVPRGGTPGQTGGADSINLSVDQLPSHSHDVTDPGHIHTVTDPGHVHPSVVADAHNTAGVAAGSQIAGNTDSAVTGVSIDSAVTGITIASAGAGADVSVLPAYASVLWIIKT